MMKVDIGSTGISKSLVVVDTNVWLSAALSPRGAPAQLLQRMLTTGRPVFSKSTFAELETRIWKPKFDRYLTIAVRQSLLHDARAVGMWVDVSPDIGQRRFSRDPDDDQFIHAALTASAAWLVTGDQDLLTITDKLTVRIITPAQALSEPTFCP